MSKSLRRIDLAGYFFPVPPFGKDFAICSVAFA
jgi:hypothetical protein